MSGSAVGRRGWGLLVVVLVVLLAWLAWDPGEASGPARVDRERRPAEGVGPTRVVDRDAGEIVAVSGDVDDAESFVEAGTVADAPSFGEPARFSGRVIDESGSPVAGARVVWIPDGWTLEARGLPLAPGRLDPADTVETVSGPDGRFKLDARHRPARPGEVQPARYMNPLRFPEVLVRAEGFASVAHPCRGFVRGDWNAGDIVLPPAAVVLGRVVDERGEPVADAEVSAERFNFRSEWSTASDDVGQKGHPREFLETVTGAGGDFALGSMDAGAGMIRVRKTGWLDGESEWFELERAERRDLGALVLSRGGRVAGVVMDDQERPLPGATVFAHALDLSVFDMGTDSILHQIGDATTRPDRILTDSAGRFEIPALEGPNQTIWADAPDHEPARVEDVALGATDVVLRLVRAARLDVTVHDAASGQPVSGARLEAFRVSSVPYWEDPSLRVESGSGPGTFVVPRPGRTATRLLVEAPGHARARVETPGVPPADRLGYEVLLSPEAILAGTVVDAAEHPVANAELVLDLGEPDPADPNAPRPWTSLSDDDGRFRFDGLPALEGRVSVRADAFVPVDPEPVLLAVGERREDLVIKLSRGGGVRGVVLAPDGAPLAGGGAGMWRRATEGEDPFASFHAVSADGEGRFELLGLVPGDYHVQSNPGGLLDFAVAADEVTDVVIQQRAKPRLTGRVTDHQGLPLAGARVVDAREYERDGETRTGYGNATQTDEFGEYELDPGWHGTIEVIAWAPGGARRSKPARVDWNRHEIVDFSFPAGSISGVVRDDLGEPMAGARVRAGAGWQGNLPVETDGAGRFELRHLDPGVHRVSAGADGFVGTFVDVELSSVAIAHEGVRLILEPGAILKGHVSTASGVPVRDGTYVNLLRGEGQLADRTELVDGVFTFEGLRAGDYELVVGNLGQADFFGSDAWIVWRGEVTVERGVDQLLEIVADG